MAENKIVFGLKNANYAVITEGVDGTFTYGTPVPLKGATSLTLEPKGEQTNFYADDLLYYTASTNSGYEGTLSLASLTEAFRKDVLGEILVATDNVLSESANAKPKSIALLFEFDGDQKAVRHQLLNVSVSRPGLSGSTKTESAEPTTSELKFVAAPRPEDALVKRSTTATTTAAVYDAWYSAVYEPTV
ncbi:major tail protein [Bacillus sp. ISL-7]|uniref:major tail protein n=1 Tax=Bacillus sp. ISL-7 TaxID=2819136 RepID=UPI001BE668BC|nr:major tail protein [Bacillus sp. ISL-7]MBT2736165.1 phage tail protein [Bacillus sp. ISL-7]